jgi:hypothetical protein
MVYLAWEESEGLKAEIRQAEDRDLPFSYLDEADVRACLTGLVS